MDTVVRVRLADIGMIRARNKSIFQNPLDAGCESVVVWYFNSGVRKLAPFQDVSGATC